MSKLVYKRRHIITQHGTDMLQVNTLVMNRWELFAKLGVGGRSEVYGAFDRVLGRDVAVKVERDSKRLANEAEVLRELHEFDMFCNLIEQTSTHVVDFLVMDLKGPSLKEIVQYYRPLSWKTVLRCGVQMLEAIHIMHSVGYVHGDIKPSSFVIGLPPNNMDQIILIDFGLSQRLKDNNATSFLKQFNMKRENDEPYTPKLHFIGSMKYASPFCHKGFRISKRDDLYSLLYTLLDLRTELPWSRVERPAKVCEMKEELVANLVVTDLGKEFANFKIHLDSLSLTDPPNYRKLRSCFSEVIGKQNLMPLSKFEWEYEPKYLWKIQVVLDEKPSFRMDPQVSQSEPSNHKAINSKSESSELSKKTSRIKRNIGFNFSTESDVVQKREKRRSAEKIVDAALPRDALVVSKLMALPKKIDNVSILSDYKYYKQRGEVETESSEDDEEDDD